ATAAAARRRGPALRRRGSLGGRDLRSRPRPPRPVRGAVHRQAGARSSTVAAARPRAARTGAGTGVRTRPTPRRPRARTNPAARRTRPRPRTAPRGTRPGTSTTPSGYRRPKWLKTEILTRNTGLRPVLAALQ